MKNHMTRSFIVWLLAAALVLAGMPQSLRNVKADDEERTVLSVTAEDVTYIEGTNGSLGTEAMYNDEEEYIGDSPEFFTYSVEPQVTITFSDETTETCSIDSVCDYTDEECYEQDDQSYENQWGVGEHTARLYFGEEYTEFKVTITETPVASLVADPVSMIEGTNGITTTDVSFDENDELVTSDPYYVYFCEPENITVTMKDGTVYTGTAAEVAQTLENSYSYNTDQSAKNVWGVGDHTATMYFMGVSSEYTVTITETPIESITVEPVSIEAYTEGIEAEEEQYDDEGNYLGSVTYYYYYAEPTAITVTYKDGTSQSGTIDEIREATGYNFEISNDQGEVHWEIGEHTSHLTFMGKEADYTVTITIPKVVVATASTYTYSTPAVTQSHNGSLEEGETRHYVSYEDGWYYLESGVYLQDKYAYDLYSEDPKPANKIGQGVAIEDVTTYAAPYLEAEVVGTVLEGTVRNLYVQSGNWYEIYTYGQYVWVRADGFEFNSPVTSTALTKVIVTASTSLYYGAGLSFEVCETIDEGETLDVYEISNGWYKVFKDGKFVWLDGNYAYDTASENPIVEDKIGQGQTTAVVTIYSAPNSSSKVYGTIAAGKTRNLYAQSGNWYEIYCASIGKFCWVRCDSFVYTKANTSSSIGTAKVAANTTTYYGHGYDYEPSVSLSKGVRVNIYGEYDGWYLVYRSGKYLWVSGEYLKNVRMK